MFQRISTLGEFIQLTFEKWYILKIAENIKIFLSKILQLVKYAERMCNIRENRLYCSNNCSIFIRNNFQ